MLYGESRRRKSSLINGPFFISLLLRGWREPGVVETVFHLQTPSFSPHSIVVDLKYLYLNFILAMLRAGFLFCRPRQIACNGTETCGET